MGADPKADPRENGLDAAATSPPLVLDPSRPELSSLLSLSSEPEENSRPGKDDAEANALIGREVDGRYRIQSILGIGGMGVVYAGTHKSLGKRVAVKVLRESYCAFPQVRDRFLQEAQAASVVGHPNVADVFDFGTLPDGRTYLVMEYLEGTTLDKIISPETPLSQRRAAEIAIEIASGLGSAHARGVVHRDIKPGNVFLVPQLRGRELVKVVDFGISKRMGRIEKKEFETVAGVSLGTPHYMSPEQVTARPLDHRSDIYSLGVLLYELLTGELPFEGNDAMEVMSKHAIEKPVAPRARRPDLKIAEGVDAVVMRALAKVPSDRFQSMTDFIIALVTAIRTMPEEFDPLDDGRLGSGLRIDRAPSSSVGSGRNQASKEKPPGERRRWPVAVAAGGALALGLVVLASQLVGGRAATGRAARSGAGAVPSAVHGPGTPGPAVAAVPGPGQSGAPSMAVGGPAAAGATAAGSVLVGPAARPALAPTGAPTVASGGTSAAASGAAPAAAAGAQPRPVTVTVHAEPEGAQVLLNDRLEGISPIVFQRPRGSQRVTIVLRRAGFADEEKPVVFDQDQVLKIKLRRLGGVASAVGTGRRPPQPEGGRSGQAEPSRSWPPAAAASPGHSPSRIAPPGRIGGGDEPSGENLKLPDDLKHPYGSPASALSGGSP